ncbi:putative polyketide synthase [Fusarium austroafricanum]|uniref:Putative polyketide synthase n=1 Tax=Fusarium austroafricanum TaxID=2364996 RepID=A0A8H4KGD5_9HYPO|nr:putative polyketide synthase [Fusarium austroafricanum]
MDHIKRNPSLDIAAVSSVLQSRRSTHPVRAHFSGTSRESILADMADFLAKHDKVPRDNIGHIPKLVNSRERSGILAVFTGQGAQWPTMGHRPEWSLLKELTADASTSRIGEAALSQPLCTAVQLALVNLLSEAGVKFDAVVGHSSDLILSSGNEGKRGGMMAAGLSLIQAREFVVRPTYKDRIIISACNAPRTATLSGDIDAIHEAKEELEKDNIFACQLKVDTAYHSQHMLPCAEPYLKDLMACDIEIKQPQGKCVWNSSVRGDTQILRGDLSSLKGQYWVDNMTAAISATWAQLGPTFVNFAGYRNAFYESGEAPMVRMIKDLPFYSWDHDRIYWREGRMSRCFRLGKDSSHGLLGRRTRDNNEFELRWRNILKLDKMPWLRGHQVLDEVLLPGASYVSITIEAGRHTAPDTASMGLIEVHDIGILRPVVVPDNKVGVETLFTARLIEKTKNAIRAHFTYYVCPDEAVGFMLQTCRGQLTIHIKTDNTAEGGVLPSKEKPHCNLASISTEKVYSLFNSIGLSYTGSFKTITDITRCLNYASNTSTWEENSLSDEYMLHPAIPDVAFQTLFVAKDHPASRQITSALLPSHIDHVLIDPSVRVPTKTSVETWALSQAATSLRGDLNIYNDLSGETFLQVEGLTVNMIGASEAAGDRSMFSKIDAKGIKMAHAVERVTMFYVNRIVEQIPPPERTNFIWYHQRIVKDEASILEQIDEDYGDEVDIKLLHAVGGHLGEVVRGNEQLLEVMTKDDMLNRFYMEGYASIPTNKFVSDVMKQLNFKFPRAKILEIGAGTGGTSWSILNAIEDATLRNTRKLLEPGGHLVLLELTGITSVRATFIMGGLEGWWLGGNDDRRLTPLITARGWDNVLQETGFSGADKVVYDLPDESKPCTSLIVSQVIDDEFLRLREPLSYDFPPLTEPLLIIGGKKLWASKVIAEIQKLLPRSWKRQIQVVEGIDKIDAGRLAPRMDTILLQDAESSVFATTMTQPRLLNLQSLLMNSKNLLWVTTAGSSHAPRASLIKGITRVVPAELPHLNTQLLDLATDHDSHAAANYITVAFLRLIQAEEASRSRDILWSQEPELEVSAHGQTMIPRQDCGCDGDGFGNCNCRWQDGKMAIQSIDKGMNNINCVQVDVHSALHMPGMDTGSIYLVFGKTRSSWVVALSRTNSSVLHLDSKDLVIVTEQHGTPERLACLSLTILAKFIAAIAASGELVLFYDADEIFALVAATELKKKHIEARFATSRTCAPADWIKFHSLASKRSIQMVMPYRVSFFADCSSGNSHLASTFKSSAPKSCKFFQLGAGLVLEAFSQSKMSHTKLINECVAVSSCAQEIQPEVIPAFNLAGADASALARKNYITNWTKKGAITLNIKPFEPMNLFKSDRTYFMAGMAGGLGLSICEWMIRNGAKNLVITSRNPQLQEATLEIARHAGATLKVIPMDLTIKESVNSVFNEVQATMPPIAGVCNAAMVLKDSFFIDMDVEQLNNTLAAKVLGSEHLDSIFNNTKLEFFICLGSVASVIGNVGQSNYHAANLFMASLIHQRCARGLAASIIHIAYFTDVGYVTREECDRQLDSHFRKVRLMPTSETDVHHAFMGAVRGGKPGSASGSHDIIMVHSRQENGVSGSAGNIKQCVQEARNEEEAVSIITQAFCVKLETVLQLATGSIDTSGPIIDLGIDSLVAVEIRTWFLKEVGADIPVVKILGGDTVEQVSTLATKMIAHMMEASQSQEGVKPEPKKTTPVTAQNQAPAPPSTAPSISTESPTSSHPATPGASRASSPPVMIEATAATPFSDRSTFTVDTYKRDSKFNSIATVPTMKSDSVNPSGVRQGVITPPELLQEQPVSPAQAHMWFISKHSGDPAAYNVVFRYRVKGPLSINRLRHALSITAYHHQALRTCFFSRLGDGQPMQGVLASPSSSPLWLNHVQEHEFLFSYHHILMDVVGLGIVLRDLNSAYNMQPLDSTESYLDYSSVQFELQKSGSFHQKMEFWKSEFSTIPETLPLLLMAKVLSRPANTGNQCHHQYRELKRELFQALEYLAWLRYGTSSLIENKAWRDACMGGEQVFRPLKNEFFRLGHSNLVLTNCYGPTEITAAATFQTIQLDSPEVCQDGDYNTNLAVGKALPNYSVCILDATGHPQPVAHNGEVCIGGGGVATGYLGLPAETSRKFITTDNGPRRYLTGDKGRLMPDGTLLYLGRLDGDTQIKFRGLRIELEEVEAAVIKASKGLISGAIVSPRGDIIVAHVTLTAEDHGIDHGRLLEILSRVKLTPLHSCFNHASPVSDSTSVSQSPAQDKMTIGEGELRLLWERVLPNFGKTGLIVPSSDFFYLGGNSMLLMKLQAAIKETMALNASTRVLYQASTLRDMAQVIDRLRREQSINDSGHDIDWDAETSIPKWLVKQLDEKPLSQRAQVPKKKGIEIIMTGATGFLGSHLLQSLVSLDDVSRVHCIAVPVDDQNVLLQDDKVEYYTGLTLGLSIDHREELAKSLDVIIHAGSSGHCLNTYATLRAPNVHSTQFLASMSVQNSIPLLFLSSNRVVLLSGDESPPPASFSKLYPSTDGKEGHMMSRWASEVFLENLVDHVRGCWADKHPWTVSIHRPSVVISDQAPNPDALNAILRFSLEDVLAEVSETAIKFARGQSSASGSTASIQFKHHSGGIKVPTSVLCEHLQSLFKTKFQELGMREWLYRASEAGMDPLITASIEGILEHDDPMIFPYMGQ